MAVSQSGERDTRFSATMYMGSEGSVISAFWITSLALSCSSGVLKRARSEVPSSDSESGLTLAAFKADSTFCSTA